MAFICLKTNNKEVINYLTQNYINSEYIYHVKKFKSFINFFIFSNDKNTLIKEFSLVLSKYISYNLEPTFLNNILKKNYFYFTNNDKKIILENFKSINNNNNNNLFYIKEPLETFLLNNKYINFEGFINFRLYNYKYYLEDLLTKAINQFVIDKEYLKYVTLLKKYVQENNPKIDNVNLIYINNSGILLDSNYKKIELTSLNCQYFSDISFSKNDLILNTLIDLLPEKIILHLLSNEENEFIKTINLIFENKVCICPGCKLCKSINQLL